MTSTSTAAPSSSAHEQLLHATCIAIGDRGVLLRGPSGAGKSDLALRLISQPPSRVPSGIEITPVEPAFAILVADDQVIVSRREGKLWARAPATLAGQLEVRGIGIVEMPFMAGIAIALVVDLVPTRSIERHPEIGQTIEINSVVVPWMALVPFEASAPVKLALALASLPHIS